MTGGNQNQAINVTEEVLSRALHEEHVQPRRSQKRTKKRKRVADKKEEEESKGTEEPNSTISELDSQLPSSSTLPDFKPDVDMEIINAVIADQERESTTEVPKPASDTVLGLPKPQQRTDAETTLVSRVRNNLPAEWNKTDKPVDFIQRTIKGNGRARNPGHNVPNTLHTNRLLCQKNYAQKATKYGTKKYSSPNPADSERAIATARFQADSARISEQLQKSTIVGKTRIAQMDLEDNREERTTENERYLPSISERPEISERPSTAAELDDPEHFVGPNAGINTGYDRIPINGAYDRDRRVQPRRTCTESGWKPSPQKRPKQNGQW